MTVNIKNMAASAINNLMWAQAQAAHNSANIQTPGFKASKSAQQQLPVYGDGLPSTVFSATLSPGYELSAGSVNSTGNSYHAHISGDGWFAVMGATGQEGYTRRGDMQVDVNNNLRNGDGLQMIGTGGPINLPPHREISISQNGDIYVIPLEGGEQQLVATLKLVKPNSELLEKSPDGLFRMQNKVPLAAATNVVVRSGGYEESNVNYMDCLLDMMNYSRSIDVNNQIIKENDQGEKASNKLLSL